MRFSSGDDEQLLPDLTHATALRPEPQAFSKEKKTNPEVPREVASRGGPTGNPPLGVAAGRGGAEAVRGASLKPGAEETRAGADQAEEPEPVHADLLHVPRTE